MTDAVANGKNGENNGDGDSEIRSSLETETLSKNGQSKNSQHTPPSGASHVSLAAEKKDTDEPVRDKPGDKLINDKGGIMKNPRRKSRSACRARSHDPNKCQMNFRDMIGKHEMRNEELEQLEGDLRERLDMLECSMPAVMVWNVLRTAQGAPPSVVRRLMEKQFQGVDSAGKVAIPSSPSQHYDHRVREIEAERKEAVRRAEEARALLTDKEAAIQERRKRLEEAKKWNEEKKERVERLHREAVKVRESMKTARGDDTSYETGECGAISCKEKLLADIGSLSSIGSADLECFAKLEELAESEVCMKQQISELERREEVYMRTLQQADELWSKMEGENSDDVAELQQQLSLKTAANQQLAERVCQLEDEQERLKKRLITCNDQLAEFTDKEHANAEVGFKDGVATIMDHGIEAQVPTATTFTSASPQTFDVDSTASPQMKDKESTYTPESVEKGISVGPKTYDKDIEAVVDLVDREVDKPAGLVLDAGVGDEALDDSIEKMDYPSGHQSGKLPATRPEEEKEIPEALATVHWDEGYPPGSIPKDMVESSTGTDNVPVVEKVPTTEKPIQATVEMIEQPVGGSAAEDIAETVEEVGPPAKDDNQQDTGLLPMTRAPEGEKKTPPMTQPHKQPTSQDKFPVREPPKAIEEVSETMDDGKNEIDESIEVIDEPVSDELRFKKPTETGDKNIEPIADRKKIDTHGTTQKTDGPASEKENVRAPEATSDKDSDDVIDRMKDQVRQLARKTRQPDSEKKGLSKRETIIDEDNDTVKDQVEPTVEAPKEDSDKIVVGKPGTIIEKDSDPVKDETVSEVPESKQKPDRPETISKSTHVAPARVENTSEESVGGNEAQGHRTPQETDRSNADRRDHKELPTRVTDSKKAGVHQPEEGIVEAARELDAPVPAGKRVSERLTTFGGDTEEAPPVVSNGKRVNVEEVNESEPGEKDSLPKREEKLAKTDEVIPDEIKSDSEETPERTDHSDSEVRAVEQHAGSIGKKPKDVEKKRLSTVQEDTKKDSPVVSHSKRVNVGEGTQPEPVKKDSVPKRKKKSSKTNEVIPDEMESDSDEGPRRSDYSDSKEEAVEKPTRSFIGKPKDIEKKEREGRSSKHKRRDDKKVETDDEEDIPEAWKDWDWDKGCPPDVGCYVSNSPIPKADKRPKDVSTLESQVRAPVEMRERSVGGRGSEDIAEINRGDKPHRNTIEKATDSSPKIQGTRAADPTGEKTNEIVLSREELRNWYNTVNSIHHTISQCANCQSQVDATGQLMSKMNNHLWIMALADDEELPVGDDELTKSLTHTAERPIESVRDLGARASEPRKSEVPGFATESISPDNLNDLLPDTSQLLDEDGKGSSEKDETLDISTARSVTLPEVDFAVDTSTDELVTLMEAKPSQSEIEANPLDEDDKETPKVSLQPSLQVPVEDELSMPLGTERRPLSQEEPSAIIEPEDEQAESATAPTVEGGEILESEEKHEEPAKRPEETIGAEQRMEEEEEEEEEQETTKQQDVDKSPAHKPQSEPDKKQQPLGTLEACVCSPQICRPVITCIPEPPTGGRQTWPKMPRTLDRLMLKTKTESPRRPPEVITWYRPLIWTRRREDKSTLTTARVGTQADSTSGREKKTHRRNDRKDDCTCSGLIPKKIDFGESYEDAPRRHPDESLPTPVRHTVAELSGSLRPLPSAVSNEHEIAVTQYMSKTSAPRNSDLCCVGCGRPITPEPTSVSLKANIRAGTKSPESLMHPLKKLTSSASRMEQKKNLCCDCELLQGTRTGKTSQDTKSEFEKEFSYDNNFCCPCPIENKNKQTKDSTKRSKNKRKPEKKDQSVTAKIPRSKQKKNKRNLDDSSVSSKPESQIHAPSIKSSSKHSGNSVTESCDDKSCYKIAPETGGSVKRLAPKLSSPCAPSPCGCSDNDSAQVPYTNYSAIFGPDINRNDCHCNSPMSPLTTHESLPRKYHSQEPN